MSTETDEDRQRREVRNLGIGCLAFVLFAVLLCIGVSLEKPYREARDAKMQAERQKENEWKRKIALEMENGLAVETAPDLVALEKEAIEAATNGNENHPFFSLRRPDAPKRTLGKVAILQQTHADDGTRCIRLADRHFLLPKELQAANPDEVETLCWIIYRDSGVTFRNIQTNQQWTYQDFDAVLEEKRTGTLLEIKEFRGNSAEDLTQWLMKMTTAR